MQLDRAIDCLIRPFPKPKLLLSYVPTSKSTAVPCSINRKDSAHLFGKARLGYWGCFEVPKEQFSLLKFTFALSARGTRLSMEMGGVKR